MNPVYQQYGKQQPNDILTRFQQFKQQFSGDPQKIVQEMLNSGKITQEQVNQAAQMANQMMRFMK